VERQTEVLMEIRDALLRLGDAPRPAEAGSGAMERRLSASEALAGKLAKEVENVRHLQDEAERIHQQDLEQLRKWLAALAREQAKDKEGPQS